MRRWLVRVVLCIAVLATVATSAPSDDFRRATADVNLTAPDQIVHVTVRFSAATVQQSGTLRIGFTGTARVIPDDPAIDPFDAASNLDLVVTDKCDGMTACDLGFSIEGGVAAFARISVEASGGESSACLGNNQFSDDATVEVVEL